VNETTALQCGFVRSAGSCQACAGASDSEAIYVASSGHWFFQDVNCTACESDQAGAALSVVITGAGLPRLAVARVTVIGWNASDSVFKFDSRWQLQMQFANFVRNEVNSTNYCCIVKLLNTYSTLTKNVWMDNKGSIVGFPMLGYPIT
jgi:hypothetical protein